MPCPQILACSLLGVLLAASVGCDTAPSSRPPAVGGEEHGTTRGTFRGRWWNYYERGCSFADGRLWSQAESDLREALRQRDRDQRRARTYGMHFVDYFAQRELGIVLFYQMRYDEASRELEKSLRDEKSARGEYYLDLVRRSLIRKNDSDHAPPQIQLDTPVADTLSKELTATVTGVARDDGYVKSVLINDRSVRIDLSAPEVPFHVQVPLKEGENLIEVTAADLSGRTAREERRVRVDRHGPMICIDEPAQGRVPKSSAQRIKGHVFDESGLGEIRVNSQLLPGVRGGEMRLDHLIPQIGITEALVVEATDRAGNTTRAEIRLSGTASYGEKILVASSEPLFLALAGDIPVHRADNTPPVVQLKDWTDEQTVFLDQIYLEGAVLDESGVTGLAINDQPILRKPGKSVYFGFLANLNEGDNLFTIDTNDAAGNRSEKRIHVRRKLQKVREMGSRLSTALLPLERKGEPGPVGAALEDVLLGELMERGRFEMVERQRLEEILREQKLSATDLAEPDSAIRIGRIMAANCVLMGSAVEKQDSLEIYARIVDTETSLILASVDVYGEEVEAQALGRLCRGLILKLCDEIPLTEGMVLQVKGSRILVDLGKASGVKKGMRLIIFNEGEAIRHPVTGAVLGTDVEEMGHGLVKAVHEQISEVETLEKNAIDRIQPMQKVITQ